MRLLAVWVSETAPAWATCLILVVLFLADRFCRAVLQLDGESYDWSLYLTLGIAVPALLLGLSVASQATRLSARQVEAFRSLLVVAGLMLAVRFVVTEGVGLVAVIAAVQLLLMQVMPGTTGRQVPEFVCSAVVLVVAWTAAARFLFWCPLDRWLGSSLYTLSVSTACLLLVCSNVFARERPDRRQWDAVALIANLDGLLLFALLSLRIDGLFDEFRFHHWGVFVGPAELVRQGSWLLWDVPSQYGFLSILTVALFPGRTVWEAFFAFNALLLFSSALLVFFVLRAPRHGCLNFPFALTCTIAAVFLLSGSPDHIRGAQLAPSLGPFRFGWVYVLLAFLYLHHRLGREYEPRLLIAGCMVWVIGTFWSAESATYCAAVWLPAYVLIVVRRSTGVLSAGGAGRPGFVTALRWFLLPPSLLMAAVGGVAVFYNARLGHGPDWRAFPEYALGFMAGEMVTPIDAHGAVLYLLLVFCLQSTVIVYFLRQSIFHPALPVAVGAWAALWSTTSYFVARSQDSNATSLCVVVVLSIGLILRLLRRARAEDAWAKMIKMSCVPVLTVVLSAAFGNTEAPTIPFSMRLATRLEDIPRQVPAIPPALLELLRAAGAGPRTPIVTNSWDLISPWPDDPASSGRAESFARPWLPVPSALFLHLSPERRMTYFDRFSARVREGGWLAEGTDASMRAWSSRELARTHKQGRTLENRQWRITWFDYSATHGE